MIMFIYRCPGDFSLRTDPSLPDRECLHLECFDFIVDSLYKATREGVKVIVQTPVAVVHRDALSGRGIGSLGSAQPSG